MVTVSRSRVAVLGLLAGLALAVAPVGAASAEDELVSVTASFSYTGAEESWTVPEGIVSLTIAAAGASGATSGAAGGSGAIVRASFEVEGGETLAVRVAGAASGSTGGWNGGGSAPGGGGGGGMSDVFLSGTRTLDNLLVAAGGGGGGGGAGNASAGPGGAAGFSGGSGGSTGDNGKAGTNSAGGAGGVSGSESGGSGGDGTGGNGISLGGGGGAGWYGGGGGASVGSFSGGGGGGGASMTTGVPAGSGTNSGNGWVHIRGSNLPLSAAGGDTSQDGGSACSDDPDTERLAAGSAHGQPWWIDAGAEDTEEPSDTAGVCVQGAGHGAWLWVDA
jgi:adhesin/invasin